MYASNPHTTVLDGSVESVQPVHLRPQAHEVLPGLEQSQSR